MAAAHLKKKGLKVLARNYRCPAGEVDLIMLDRSTARRGGAETIVIVEVKTRTSDKHTAPASAVNADKKKRISKVASYYLSRRDTADYRVRFDVVSVVASPGSEVRIDHISGAF